MSRKTKPHKPHSKPVSPHAMDSVALAAEAEAALGASRHKEAIELYKELIKRERQPNWIDGLASCYAGRARDLASKGMVKEALVLWRNRTQLCGKPLAEEPYLGWLLQAGELGEMFRLLADKNLPDATRAELETRLAATVLAMPDNTLAGLPTDGALLRHRAPVLEALAAYHRGDFVALGEQLQMIPFRSPYRDLKPALKALALLQTDAEAAQAAIARLPSDGPFERLMAVLRAAVLPEGEWLAALRGLDEGGRQMVLDIKGCPDTLRPLLLELAKLGDAPAAIPLIDLLLRYRRAMPEDKFIGLYHRLLPHLGRRLLKNPDYAKLPIENMKHILALAGELLGELEDAGTDWRAMAELLGARPEQRLRAALIWRHAADLYPSRKGGLDKHAFEYLKKSLELDPEDRDSYLTVIRALRSGNDLAQARAYLDKALPRFPKDAGVLLEAVEVALAGKAFKKAVGLAKQVLELDPINPQVRELIAHALFSHARKQIKAGNNPAARKELDAAEEWLRAPSDRATLKLLRALAGDETDDTNARLREAMADFGGTLMGAFQLLLEADKVGANPKTLLLCAGIDLAATPATETVVVLARALNEARDGKKAIRAALAPLRASLKRAATSRFSEAEHLLVCEAWQRSDEEDLLFTYAEAALKRWPGRPVFVYFRVMARYGNDSYNIPDRDMHALDKAYKDAKKQGDQRTAQRILTLLEPPMDDMPFSDGDPFDTFGDMPGSPRAMFELLLAMKGEQALLDMVRRAIGKRAFNDLKQQFGGNQKDFTRRLIDMMVEDEARIKRQQPTDFLPPPINLPPPPPRGKSRPHPEIQKDLFDD
ncbi:MAG: hypothetical protein HY936_05550 [Nitrosomonadales bacterium]|nr:hypothetical protein [Nitrosomonadales bacterium]